jgi:hypothetical protein
VPTELGRIKKWLRILKNVDNQQKRKLYSQTDSNQRGIYRMTFKIIVERMPLRVEFEVGSLSEAVAALQEEDTQIRRIGSIADELNGTTAISSGTVAEGEQGQGETPRRGRRSNKDKSTGPDPATASAPAPLPVPGETPPVTPTAANEPDIPPSLDRRAPPPPPAPPAPPPAPVVPPSGILAGKVIANLDGRKEKSADGGAALVTWLAGAGVCQDGVSYDEAVAVVRLMKDEQLGGIATALQIAA